jgi:hypothetical protein
VPDSGRELHFLRCHDVDAINKIASDLGLRVANWRVKMKIPAAGWELFQSGGGNLTDHGVCLVDEKLRLKAVVSAPYGTLDRRAPAIAKLSAQPGLKVTVLEENLIYPNSLCLLIQFTEETK